MIYSVVVFGERGQIKNNTLVRSSHFILFLHVFSNFSFEFYYFVYIILFTELNFILSSVTGHEAGVNRCSYCQI
jgi:hypothetical protein